MYELVQISKLNDFIFCPQSVYLHSIYESFDQGVYHGKSQNKGKISHEGIEEGKYSSAKNVLQGIQIYSDEFRLIGKIDIFDMSTGYLIERKYKINKIYDGYKYQLYAEYYCILERGYNVQRLFFHSLADNQRYEIAKPTPSDKLRFSEVIEAIWAYQVGQKPDVTIEKCRNCIYKTLCEFSLC